MSEAMRLRDEYRMVEWSNIVAQRQASGLSVQDFCREQGLSQQAYYYRLRKLRQQCSEPILQEFQLEAPANAKQSIQIQYHGAVIEIKNDTALETVLRTLQRL